MTLDFAGKVAVVTGASGNLGTAVVNAFYAAGASVASVDHKAPPLDKAATAADERRFGVVADLRDAASTQAAVDAIVERYRRIDVLCNIAGGFASGTPVHETPDEVWRRMFDLNAMSVVNTARAVVPRMIAAGRGNIVNVAAASSVRGQANTAAYALAKNAVVRLTESMAAELRPHGICVTCILPTVIDTPQNRAAMPGSDASQWLSPVAIAKVMVFLASDAALIASGAGLPLGGRDRTR